ncbi:T9SS type B sorting domain-containing protein [Hymenobacter crusticola]|uniref:PKD-like domain-containing protein n=1 Tax=Hymenobacter crusticola TaxID=1770526 RepID=A0A243WEM5_9BACT|nr:gliding motility-associated C-terminal domain-containing protein [Hymenobacter crusticola]OUJ74184.1 hypothetical protein BXP70_10640 [Hymenobacter crusticola]
MQKLLLRSLVAWLVLLIVQVVPAAASHLIGGDISYRYLGVSPANNTLYRYRITALIYINSDCTPGTNLSNVPDGRSNIFVSLYDKASGNRINSGQGNPVYTSIQTGCGVSITQNELQPNGTFRLPRVANPAITPPTPGGCTTSGSAQPKVRLCRYEADIDLPLSFQGYYAVYSDGTRNADIANLRNPDQQNQTIYVEMAPPLLPNSSPTFSDTAVVVICQGDTSLLLNNAVDPDGDRLIYSFSTPYSGSTGSPTNFSLPNTVTYNAGYSATTPFGSGPGNYASLNASTGLSRYQAAVIGRFVVAVEVKEYRTINGVEVLIGSTRREVQLVSRQCQPNQTPKFTAPTLATRSFTIEEGQSVNFNLASTDADGNPITLRVNSVLLDGAGGFDASFAGQPGVVQPGNVTGTASVTGTGGSVNGQFVFNSKCGNARLAPYDVVVTATDVTCGAKSVSEVFQVTVVKAASPASLTGDNTICDRSAAYTYTAGGASAGTYQWRVYGGAIQGASTGNTVQVRWNTIGTGRITVRSLSSQGCLSDSVSRMVEVRPVELTITPSASSICLGSDATLTVAGGLNYTWTGGGQTFSGSSITVSPTQTTTYTVTSTNGQCTGTRQVVVTVNAAAVANAGPDATLCADKRIRLGTPALPGLSYQWSPVANLNSATDAQPLLTAINTTASPLTLTYTVTATAAGGCTAISTVRITVNPRPATDSINGTASVCPTVQGVTYSIRNPRNTAYQWVVAGGSIASGQGTNTITVNWGDTNANASVKAFTLNSFGCSSDTIALPVRINRQLATARPTGPLSVCQADGLFTYQTLYTNGSAYAWQVIGGTQVSTNLASVQVRWNQVGVGKIVVTETSNPSAAIRCLGQSDTLYVNVLPSPSANLALSGPDRVCASSGTISFSLPGAASSKYQFALNGTALASTTSTAIFTTPAAGTYTLTARETNASGCAGPVYTKQFIVDPTPAPVTINGPRSVCPENLSGLRYSVTGLAGSSFQWTIGGGTVVSGQGTNGIVVNFTAGTAAKTISVTETSSFGCNSAINTLTVTPDNVSLNLQLASVDAQSDTKINLNLAAISNAGNGNRINILRRDAGSTGAYMNVGNVANTAATFSDTNADADAQAYQYQLQLTNACGTVLSSTEHTTVRLEAVATPGQGGRDEGRVTLRWNAYLGLSITQYAIYRRVDGGAEELVQTVPATSGTQYTQELITGAQGFNQCFRIRAVSSVANLGPSLSNEACVEFENPLAFYNIITPNGDGVNDVVYIDNVQLYPGNTFTIFNRWGKEIYSTSNYRNTWGGEGASAGVYYYVFKLADGTKKKGWFEIVR